MNPNHKINRKSFLKKSIMVKILILGIIQVVVTQLSAQKILMSWNFSGINGVTSKTANYADAGISSTAPSALAVRGDGILSDNFSNGLGGRSIDKLTAIEGLNAKDYITFTVTPTTGKQLNLSSIQLKPFSQNVVRSFALYSSKTGFSSGNEIGYIQSDGTLKTITLNGFTNLTSAVEFRIVIYGVADQWTNASLGEYNSHTTNDLVVNGDVADYVADNQPPTTPTGLNLSNITKTSFTLSWIASTDNTAVTSYEVFKNGVSIGTTANTSMDFAALSCATNYTLTVKAKDAANNISAESTSFIATTAACSNDIVAPTTPTNLIVTNITRTNLDITWTASTDNVGVKGYEIFANGNSVGTTTTTSFSIIGLSCATTYSVSVKAFDDNGNFSASCDYTAKTAACPITENVYFIGNSVTDAINYDGLQAIAQSCGNTHNYGRQMIPGSPLENLWANPAGGFTTPPYNYPTNAFTNYKWNTLSLQPFDRFIYGTNQDLEMIGNFINMIKVNSPDVQVFIYERWPRTPNSLLPTDASLTADTWNNLWKSNFTGSFDNTNETADYFEKLAYAVRNSNSFGVKKVLLSPVGQVMYEINKKMAAGLVAGYSKIWDVYSDGIHLKPIGSYIAACTYYATIYQSDPRGTFVPGNFGTIPVNVAAIIQQTVWDVVTQYKDNSNATWSGVDAVVNVPVTGVTLNSTSVSLQNNTTYQLIPTVTPLDASNKTMSWTSSNELIASVDNTGLVSAKGVGNATITATTADGAKSATCSIIVSSPNGPDTQSPSVPTALNAQNITDATIDLSWVESIDNVGIVGYDVYNGATKLNTQYILTNSYKITGLTACTNNSITVKANDAAGNVAISTPLVVKTNCAPTAVLNANLTLGNAPLAISFDANGSSDPDAGDFILGFDWDFGDGSSHSNANAPSHIYQTANTYTVSLRVMDNRGFYSEPVTKIITVNSNSTAVSSQSSEPTVSIYPNPATNIVTIKGSKLKIIQLFDMCGKLVFTKSVDNEAQTMIDIASLNPGSYIIHVENDTNFSSLLVLKK
jgi:PKD repeat protein/chitodextrinase